MPLIEIYTGEAQPHEGIADAVHEALVGALGVPDGDRFQIHTRGAHLDYDREFMIDGQRGDGFLVIKIHLARGRPIEQKKGLYAALASTLERQCGARPEDVFVALIEVDAPDFSFGEGLAQFADHMPAHLQALDQNN